MPHITTCTSCGKCYEEVSEELANAPERECISCWRSRKRNDERDCRPSSDFELPGMWSESDFLGGSDD